MRRIFAILMIFMFGCEATSNMGTNNMLAEKNKAVLILAILIQDQLRSQRRTNGRLTDLTELLQNDTLKRISNIFKMIEVKSRGGYISVYYKLSGVRNSNIELTGTEKQRVRWAGWGMKDLNGGYDGEIRFDYGERFYNLRKIIVREE